MVKNDNIFSSSFDKDCDHDTFESSNGYQKECSSIMDFLSSRNSGQGLTKRLDSGSNSSIMSLDKSSFSPRRREEKQALPAAVVRKFRKNKRNQLLQKHSLEFEEYDDKSEQPFLIDHLAQNQAEDELRMCD